MRLYIDIEYKDKEEMFGTIYNRPRKNQKEIYLRYNAQKRENTIILDIYEYRNGKHYIATLENNFDIRFYAKDILIYVQQRLDRIQELFR